MITPRPATVRGTAPVGGDPARTAPGTHGPVGRAAPLPAGIDVRLQKVLPDVRLDVSWSIGNEVGVLFGYSGVGKSLTLQMIAGLLVPDTGVVKVGGEALYDAETSLFLPPQRRNLGYVTQDVALFPHLDVRGNVAYGLAGLSRQQKAERVAELVELFHLEGLEGRRPSELSGGQRQRVALARALARRPRALLLDEPFAGLDAPLRLELWEALHDIRRRAGIPVLLVTHDPFEARTMAERLIVYGRDGVVRAGTPETLLACPDCPELQTLLGWDAFGKAAPGGAA